tara:strand:- start:137 stop:571 length:435 start_codon:yes stop_codon:yes gene_type:complete
MWYNYIILWINENKYRTYNGMTNNLDRRFKQHNNILKGGARTTTNLIKKYPNTEWKPICIISGFQTKSEAMKAEWRIRHPDFKKYKKKEFIGDEGRIRGLNYILNNSEKWTSSSENIYDQNLKIELDENYKKILNIENIKINFF